MNQTQRENKTKKKKSTELQLYKDPIELNCQPFGGTKVVKARMNLVCSDSGTIRLRIVFPAGVPKNYKLHIPQAVMKEVLKQRELIAPIESKRPLPPMIMDEENVAKAMELKGTPARE